MPPSTLHARLNALLHPAFVSALVVLVVNDHLLKAAFHNAVTGKLSDFAGVFTFAYFLGVLAGRRLVLVHLAVALAFAWWKSPASQPFIDAWNTGPWFDITRVVDPTDLLALLVLPASLTLLRRAWRMGTAARRAWVRWTVALVALLAFTATSRVSRRDVDLTYLSPVPADALVATVLAQEGDADASNGELMLFFEMESCGQAWARFEVQAAGDLTLLRLRRIESHQCDIEGFGWEQLFNDMRPALSLVQARLLRPHPITDTATTATCPET
ncbi:hypothetical protein LJR143_003813 [Pseudoxanthomonas sp. LjRoot143]|uniref:hypothetical protein n=1 Tax=Pseudoxanthomonas sp. LjRoot143 TaxID=3342266 RepID=UPI003ECC390E